MKSNKDKMKKLNKWKERFEEADSLGVSRSKHLKSLGYSKDTFYYWKRQLKLYGMLDNKDVSADSIKSATDNVSVDQDSDEAAQGFVRLDFLPMPDEPVKVIVNGFEILIPSCASKEQIGYVMDAAKNA